MRKKQRSTAAADPVYVAVKFVIGDEVCRVEVSPATFRGYEREAHRRGVTVADLLHDAVHSVLADRYRLN